MNVSGKIIVISGGNGGIGSALVKQLHEKGAVVYSLDMDAVIPQVIKGVHYISVDLTNASYTEEALKLIRDVVDIVILNTGIMRRGTIFESSEEDFDLIFDSNLKASWMLLKYLQPILKKDATIVQVASGHALNPEADPGLYTLSKKAAVALGEMITLTNQSYDVRTAYPGPVLTNLLLSGRTEPEKERISKIAMPTVEFAEKLIGFLESDKKKLLFNPDDFSYNLK